MWLQRRIHYASVAYDIWDSHRCQLKKKNPTIKQTNKVLGMTSLLETVAGGCITRMNSFLQQEKAEWMG